MINNIQWTFAQIKWAFVPSSTNKLRETGSRCGLTTRVDHAIHFGLLRAKLFSCFAGKVVPSAMLVQRTLKNATSQYQNLFFLVPNEKGLSFTMTIDFPWKHFYTAIHAAYILYMHTFPQTLRYLATDTLLFMWTNNTILRDKHTIV